MNTKIKERLTDNPQWGLNGQSFLQAGVGLPEVILFWKLSCLARDNYHSGDSPGCEGRQSGGKEREGWVQTMLPRLPFLRLYSRHARESSRLSALCLTVSETTMVYTTVASTKHSRSRNRNYNATSTTRTQDHPPASSHPNHNANVSPTLPNRLSSPCQHNKTERSHPTCPNRICPTPILNRTMRAVHLMGGTAPLGAHRRSWYDAKRRMRQMEQVRGSRLRRTKYGAEDWEEARIRARVYPCPSKGEGLRGLETSPFTSPTVCGPRVAALCGMMA